LSKYIGMTICVTQLRTIVLSQCPGGTVNQKDNTCVYTKFKTCIPPTIDG